MIAFLYPFISNIGKKTNVKEAVIIIIIHIVITIFIIMFIIAIIKLRFL